MRHARSNIDIEGSQELLLKEGDLLEIRSDNIPGFFKGFSPLNNICFSLFEGDFTYYDYSTISKITLDEAARH